MEEAWTALCTTQSVGAALMKVAQTRQQVLDMMHSYIDRIGLDIKALDGKILHAAGTKGKGSTAAMCESILRHHGLKTGLFISPHLVDVRERIRLNGELVSKEAYLDSFWRVWDAIEATKSSAGPYPEVPGYFHFLTLLATDVFINVPGGLDAVVLEVGMGGKLDATNVFPRPCVTCVTTLDYDHMHVLGHTITEIAREKAGIFKPGVPALSSPQVPEAEAELQRVAVEAKAASFHVIPSTLAHRTKDGQEPLLGLAGEFQVGNAALAVAATDVFLSRRTALPSASEASYSPRTAQLDDNTLRGLARVRFDGRAQIVLGAAREGTYVTAGAGIVDTRLCPSYSVTAALPPNVCLCLDGAHTERSIREAAAWFASVCQAQAAGDSESVLIFNCGSDKDAAELCVPLSSLPFSSLLICPADVARAHTTLPPSPADAVRAYLKHRAERGAVCPPYEPEPTASVWEQEAPVVSPELAWQATLSQLWSGIQTDPSLQRYREADRGWISERGSVVLPPPQRLEPVIVPSIDAALSAVITLAEASPSKRFNVFITGSLYLVGGVLSRLL